jgi:hypothetical protein
VRVNPTSGATQPALNPTLPTVLLMLVRYTMVAAVAPVSYVLSKVNSSLLPSPWCVRLSAATVC